MTILIVLLVIIIVVVLWVISAQNRLMREEQNVFTERNNVELVVDRRYKNIEATVNLMKAHNAEIAKAYERITAMRSGVKPDSVESYANLDKELQNVAKSINVQVERYPDLGQFFDVNKFQTTMAQHDRDVEMAKKLYNHEVEEYNTLILTIPYSLLAGGRTKHNYWEVIDAQTKDEYIPEFK